MKPKAKPAAKKEPAFNARSRRQMWQNYQHILKAHEYFKACYLQVKKENDQIKDFAKRDHVLEKYFNEAMVETWVTLNGIKRLCKRLFNQDITALEVYK